MNERERWIVYPLLFLALGAALRDKLVDRTITKSIVCQELSIVDEESTGREPQRTLVRIGTKANRKGKSSAALQLNGDLEILDEDLSENSPARVLFRAGRTDPLPGAPSIGRAFVRGEFMVDGELAARQYVWQGMPLLPIQVAPGLIVPGIPQPVPQPAPNATTPNQPKTQPSNHPPTGSSKKDGKSTTPSSPADDGK